MMSNLLDYLGRAQELFVQDLTTNEDRIQEATTGSSFLVVGGAGSIGRAVVKAIFERDPEKLHVVDLSENNLVELVRDLRSSAGYIRGDFKTFALDVGSLEFELMFLHEGPYDYVLNLSALKHVRSERDPYSLMRMIRVNVLNTLKSMEMLERSGSRYFAVSTDKATDPVNLMGATKLLMEQVMFSQNKQLNVSSARFANVAFSDGSLLSSFSARLDKGQPIVAPIDIRRYFITAPEAGSLCLLAALLGGDKEIFFPKPSEELAPLGFDQLAMKFLEERGLEPRICDSEEEAREIARLGDLKKGWPCYFAASDTTGEKELEEFFSQDDKLMMARYKDVGVIKARASDEKSIAFFLSRTAALIERGRWSKDDLVQLINDALPNLNYEDLGYYLDQKM